MSALWRTSSGFLCLWSYLTSQPSIYTVFTSAGEGNFSPRKLEYVVDFAQEHGLALKGDARGNLLASVLEDGELTGFFEAWILYETES